MKKKIFFTALSFVAAMSLSAAVVATVDGENITDDDIQILLSQAMPGVDTSKLNDDLKKKVIDDIVGRKLLLKEAKSSGIEKDPEFKKALDIARENIAGELYFKKIFDTIKVNDAEVKKFYDENKENFNQPASVQARHILVEKEEDAKSIISSLKKLKGDALNKKFEEIAKEKSIDKGSAVRGGELGWFGQSQMVKPFADAVFSMTKGEVSKNPVKSQFGYHIILKEDMKPAGIIPFKDVKEQIEQNVKMQKFQEVIKQKTDTLRSKAKVQYK
ncbi:SurA-like chaperone / peptidyl-prolyl cis-trans isomerase [Campylobacter pinnipediorum subsp. caledonicus]|uniref:peptidylprolyl isomerase n=1 Tax=Campylobacter pinnipediorum subsp. caledonicus TaxID=1874362 RepID=A0A1S6U8C3_9BACT|nr:peptidyl-prolyl cis-trans isomerase [Campylobacter pinnipediorum]AQW87949.1 SurA-like chaperone / peptidyl-prolyl cis-trans isomerase [Campylobacter pinnipediorum subsp. caledonicus]OPA71396.1 peptidylprolyl isomerase [Campylobacter pinnipediorum subsp. caledonicus]